MYKVSNDPCDAISFPSPYTLQQRFQTNVTVLSTQDVRDVIEEVVQADAYPVSRRCAFLKDAMHANIHCTASVLQAAAEVTPALQRSAAQ